MMNENFATDNSGVEENIVEDSTVNEMEKSFTQEAVETFEEKNHDENYQEELFLIIFIMIFFFKCFYCFLSKRFFHFIYSAVLYNIFFYSTVICGKIFIHHVIFNTYLLLLLFLTNFILNFKSVS